MPLAPEYQAMFAELAKDPGPALQDLSPEEGREMYRLMRAPAPELGRVRTSERAIDGPAGDIRVRIYQPESLARAPVFVNYHGGGWVIGDLDTADAACRYLAESAGMHVVSVDYRLAPEHPYPAAVDDAYAAALWCHAHATDLGGDGRLIVGGESAGGNLAAAVSLRARDSGAFAIDAQCLFYPVVDHDMSRTSYAANGEDYLLTTAAMHWFWDHYCPPAQRSEPSASPLRAPDLANLPPAVVVTAEFDPLRDEGMAYADALRAAGNDVQARCYEGLVHDFFATAHLFECSRTAFLDTCTTLNRILGNP